jgi:hypothetical protein
MAEILPSGKSVFTANANVATVLGSIPASLDTVKFEGRQMKQYLIKCFENPKTHTEITMTISVI